MYVCISSLCTHTIGRRGQAQVGRSVVATTASATTMECNKQHPCSLFPEIIHIGPDVSHSESAYFDISAIISHVTRLPLCLVPSVGKKCNTFNPTLPHYKKRLPN